MGLDSRDRCSNCNHHCSAGDFDIKQGEFSFYAQMRIQNGYINGWVKPIFRDVKIAERQDKENKSILHKAKVGAAKVLAKVLENPPKKQIATTTNISGPIEDPNSSVFQIVTPTWSRTPGFTQFFPASNPMRRRATMGGK